MASTLLVSPSVPQGRGLNHLQCALTGWAHSLRGGSDRLILVWRGCSWGSRLFYSGCDPGHGSPGICCPRQRSWCTKGFCSKSQQSSVTNDHFHIKLINLIKNVNTCLSHHPKTCNWPCNTLSAGWSPPWLLRCLGPHNLGSQISLAAKYFLEILPKLTL